MLHFVITPKRPSLPINSYFKSNPVLSLRSSESKFNISPLAKTDSIPVIWPLKGPCLIKVRPPTCVAKLPPIYADPFAPRSQGSSYPYGFI